jgi:hypothetical protein
VTRVGRVTVTLNDRGERRNAPARLHLQQHGVFLPLLLVLISGKKKGMQGGSCSEIGGVSRSSVAPQVTSVGDATT